MDSKLIRISAVFLVYLTCSVTGFASTEDCTSNTKPLANIMKGNMRVGGSFSLTDGSYQGATLQISPTYQYFVADRFSVGGSGSLFYSFADSSRTSWFIGPSASYYFWHRDKTAAYVSQGLFYSYYKGLNSSSVTYFSSGTQLGLDYFIVPSVSFGPAIQWYHIFENTSRGGTTSSEDFYSFLGNFSIFF